MVEERSNVVDVGERSARKRRVAAAAEVRADDVMVRGERVHLAVPKPPVADACME
jgi:hypothetical protein